MKIGDVVRYRSNVTLLAQDVFGAVSVMKRMLNSEGVVVSVGDTVSVRTPQGVVRFKPDELAPVV